MSADQTSPRPPFKVPCACGAIAAVCHMRKGVTRFYCRACEPK